MGRRLPFPAGLLLAILLLAPAASRAEVPAAAPPTGEEELGRENQLLAAELALAAKPQFYLLFDFPGRRIHLRARGRSFKEWEIRGFSFWGRIASSRPLLLTQRSTLFDKPERVTIVPPPPGDPASDTAAAPAPAGPFELDALEMSDMPTRYTLTLEEGIRIGVAPRGEGTAAAMARLAHRLWWTGTLPLRSLWSSLTGKPYVAIDLALSPEDAQGLYWAFPEGSAALLYHPGE